MPGAERGAFLYRDVEIPADAKDQEVWLRVEAPCDFAIVNGRLRYWDIGHSSSSPSPRSLEIDITPDLRFGKTNRIVLANHPAMTVGRPRSSICERVGLGLFARANGRGTARRPARPSRPGNSPPSPKTRSGWGNTR